MSEPALARPFDFPESRPADAQDWAHVTDVVEAAGTSFFWAMRVLPKPERRAMFAVYAFCREVDDIADSEDPADKKQRDLDLWREEIGHLFAGRDVAYPTARALQEIIPHYQLQQEDFEAMIDGMAMDAAGPIRAPSQSELDLYCDRVASAVGRMSVPIFGQPGEEGRAVATHLGRALQLTNILRDVHEDAEIGRLYLPRELLNKHGIATTDPFEVLGHPNLPLVAREMGQWAREAFNRAEKSIDICDPKAMRPAVMMLAVYRRMLKKMFRADFIQVGKPESRNPVIRLRRKASKLAVAVKYGILTAI